MADMTLHTEDEMSDPREVPDEAASWIAQALADPDARNGEITFRAARAVFGLVRRFDATGVSGWEDAPTCSCCLGDPRLVCDACGEHSCWAGEFMCWESTNADIRVDTSITVRDGIVYRGGKAFGTTVERASRSKAEESA